MVLHSSRTKIYLVTLFFMAFFTYYLYNFPASNIRDKSLESTTKPTEQHEQHEQQQQQQQQQQLKTDICKTDRVQRNTDPNHTNAHIEFWRHLSDATVQVYKRRWQKFISSVKRTQIPDTFNGRGIIFVAGNRDTFQRTLTAIKMLRNMHHCELDIEVWHLSDEKPTDIMIEELKSLHAVPKDLSDPKLVRPIQHRRDAEKQ
jgi:alpha 1,2-mannosyltransferase